MASKEFPDLADRMAVYFRESWVLKTVRVIEQLLENTT